jgi:hypothetical protein
MLLQTKGLMTAQDLAERLEVSPRTIYRDLDALSAAGVPVYAERGPQGGCMLLESYRTNLTGLKEDEVRALFMFTVPGLLADLGADKASEAAMLKLTAALPAPFQQDVEQLRHRIHLDTAPWFQPEEPASGNANFVQYLQIPAVPGSGELIIFCAALVGAGLGFLWFNTYPAQVFMGDIGALALGAALGTIAVIVRQELVVLIMGGIFVIETASVILQVISFKTTGKRIFRMAPIHHHYELKGWTEPKIIVRFWIITFILVLAGLATLKLR